MDVGTSKIVLWGRHGKVGRVTATDTEVLLVTTQEELQRSHQILHHMTLRTLETWTPFERRYLKAYCFALPPSASRASVLGPADLAHLVQCHGSNPHCARILRNPELWVVATRRLTPVNHSNAIDLAMRDAHNPATFAHIKAAIGWVLVDLILSGHLLACDRVCHGDIKLNNILSDDESHRFKLNDFGLASLFGTVDFDGRFGRVLCPWYPPIFLALATVKKALTKRRLQLRHVGLIDRFAFVGVVFQLGCAAHASQCVKPEWRTKLCAELFGLIRRLAQPAPFGPHRDPTTKRERVEWQEYKEFLHQSAKYNDVKLAHYVTRKCEGERAFCQMVKDHELYQIQSWSAMFTTVSRWAWPRQRPTCVTSLLSFIQSKRPAHHSRTETHSRPLKRKGSATPNE